MSESEHIFRMACAAFACGANALSRGDMKTFARCVEKHRQLAHRYKRAVACERRRPADMEAV